MRLTWKGGDLYLGIIYAGSVTRIVPDKWRETYSGMNALSAERAAWFERYEERPWRAWINTDEDGTELGHFATRAAAKDALEEALRKS